MSGKHLRLLHCGSPKRGRDFIERFYGHLPPKTELGWRMAHTTPSDDFLAQVEFDLLLLETNRLLAPYYRQAGFLLIPEWVEFGREVGADLQSRYAGARKSLKSELKNIRKSAFEVSLSKKDDDFLMFYEEMYLPYNRQRFGDSTILKSKKKLRKDFRAGFLFFLLLDTTPIAGALVRVDGSVVTETTLGVRDRAESYLAMGVSGAIDYYLFDWAAKNGKRFLNVGHTRPLPLDGIYFNKRKWLMSIMPDRDGVMDLGLKVCSWEAATVSSLAHCPFVFQLMSGLGVVVVCHSSEQVGIDTVDSYRKRFTTKGLKYLIIVSPAGFRKSAFQDNRQLPAIELKYFTHMDQVMAWQKHQAADK